MPARGSSARSPWKRQPREPILIAEASHHPRPSHTRRKVVLVPFPRSRGKNWPFCVVELELMKRKKAQKKKKKKLIRRSAIRYSRAVREATRDHIRVWAEKKQDGFAYIFNSLHSTLSGRLASCRIDVDLILSLSASVLNSYVDSCLKHRMRRGLPPALC